MTTCSKLFSSVSFESRATRRGSRQHFPLENDCGQVIHLFRALAEVNDSRVQSLNHLLGRIIGGLPNYLLQPRKAEILTLGILPLVEAVGDQHKHVARSETHLDCETILDTWHQAQRDPLCLKVFGFTRGGPVQQKRALACREHLQL